MAMTFDEAYKIAEDLYGEDVHMWDMEDGALPYSTRERYCMTPNLSAKRPLIVKGATWDEVLDRVRGEMGARVDHGA